MTIKSLLPRRLYISTRSSIPQPEEAALVTPEAGPNCPEGTNEAGNLRSGSVVQCQWNSLGGGSLARGTGVRADAILTTAKGDRFAVLMLCTRVYSMCPQPQESAVYSAELSEDSKWLRDFAKRPMNGGMRIRVRLGNNKPVSYLIVKVEPFAG